MLRTHEQVSHVGVPLWFVDRIGEFLDELHPDVASEMAVRFGDPGAPGRTLGQPTFHPLATAPDEYFLCFRRGSKRRTELEAQACQSGRIGWTCTPDSNRFGRLSDLAHDVYSSMIHL
jgi:hypothetical protein